MRAAAKIAAAGASVREIERLARRANAKPKAKVSRPRPQYYEETELALKEHLGRKVSVEGTRKRGVLRIEFYGEDDLAELMKLIH